MKSPDQNTSVRGERGHLFDVFDRFWAKVVDGLAAIGTIMICALMLIICADILFRNGFGASLPMVSELGGLMLVMIVYLQLATAIRADRLARTDIFLPGFKRRFPLLGGLLSAMFDLVGASMIALIAWSTIRILEKDIASGQFIGVQGIATVQTWPFRALILLGVAVAAIEFVVRAISGLRAALKERNPA